MSRENKKNTHKNEISRKEALIRMGKYAALTSIGTFIILNPKKAQAMSPEAPGTGWWCMQVSVWTRGIVETATRTTYLI